MKESIARAFGNLKLFCFANQLTLESIRNFTMENMHASKNAFPFLGCKGSDTVIILKWLFFLSGLLIHDAGKQWTSNELQLLQWMREGCQEGLKFTQGMFGHGVWMKPTCLLDLRQAIQKFAVVYTFLARHCLQQKLTLYGMVPKYHALLHFRGDCDDALRDKRMFFLNPAVFDNSMSEDFIGQIARASRRIFNKHVERTLCKTYKTKAHFAVEDFLKCRRL